MKKIGKNLLILLLILGFGGQAMLPVFAEGDEGDEEYLQNLQAAVEKLKNPALADTDLELILRDEVRPTDCAIALDTRYAVELNNFFQFLKDNFENKSSTSSLSNIAFVRYRMFRDKLYRLSGIMKSEVDLETPKSTTATYQVTLYREYLDAYTKCSTLTEDYISKAKMQMMRQVKTTSYQKKTTILAEKYKAINTGLRELNNKLATTYAFIMTFNNKLSCFVSEKNAFKSLW